MPTPLAEYWRPLGAAGAWRKAASDPPPAPPTVVEWLERREGAGDGAYMQRVSLGALPDFRGAQKP